MLAFRSTLTRDAAGSDGASGGGGATPAPAAAPAAASAPAAAPAPAPSGDNLFAAAAAKAGAPAPAAAPAPASGTPAAPAPAAPAPADPNRPAWLPEQFKTPEDLAKSYAELKQRMVDTGLPPKDAAEYKFDLPETLKGSIELDDARMIEARKAFHGLGLTQKQFEGVMSAYFSNVESLAAYGAQLASAQTSAALGQLWKVPASQVVEHPNMTAAMKALNSYGDEKQRAEFMSGVVSLATVTDILAKVGREVGEDKTRIAGEVIAAETLNDLMKKGSPYWDAAHPDHERVKAQVTKHFAAQAAIEAAKRSA